MKKKPTKEPTHKDNCPNISVCVVAKNGERTYARLFNSLRAFADRFGDMVLVDTGSTDDTQAIYKAFGFRVFPVGDTFMIKIPDELVKSINHQAARDGETKQILEAGSSLFNFSGARNHAASLAKNDYIINPDADEALTVFDIPKVEEYFGKFSRFQYEFVFDHHPDGKPHLQFVTDTRASDRRFWKWAGLVHETNTEIHKDATMGYVPPDVFKVEHWQVDSPTRTAYLAGLAYATAIEPNNDRNSHYYGRELYYRGFYHSAIRELQRHVDMNQWPEERANSLCFMGDSHLALGHESEALCCYKAALSVGQPTREPWMRIAAYHYQRDHFAEAREAASAAITIPKTGFYGLTPANYENYPHEILYWANWWLGDKEASAIHWAKALAYRPNNPKYLSDAEFYR